MLYNILVYSAGCLESSVIGAIKRTLVLLKSGGARTGEGGSNERRVAPGQIVGAHIITSGPVPLLTEATVGVGVMADSPEEAVSTGIEAANNRGVLGAAGFIDVARAGGGIELLDEVQIVGRHIDRAINVILL